VVKESTLHYLLYVTAALLAVFLTIHVLTHVPGVFFPSYSESVQYESVKDTYGNLGWALLILLFIAAIHGLTGLRGILLELGQSRRWERTVDFLVFFLGVYIIGIGMYTLLSWLGILVLGG